MDNSFDIYNYGEQNTNEVRRLFLNSPDGISFYYIRIPGAGAGKIIIENQQPVIRITYTTSGQKLYHTTQPNLKLVEISANEYNYLLLNKQHFEIHWPAGKTIEYFELGISPAMFLQYLPAIHPFVNNIRNAVERNIPMVLSNFNLPLSPTVSNMLFQVLDCPLEGYYKQLYLKSKLLEILAFQLTQFEQVNGSVKPVTVPTTLKKEDIDRMYYARDIITSNIDSPCSLIDLAHQVGTNEAYLKKHFKQVFNNTVFGYLQNVKMDMAQEMLLQGKTVAEVADKSGYKHAAHFARAFKKHFGFPPNKAKK